MKKITLWWKNLKIGDLMEHKGIYIYIPFTDNFEDAIGKGCPAFILETQLFNQHEAPELLPFFYEFIPSVNRKDIYEKCNILNDDTEYEKLLKLTKLTTEKNHFWISEELNDNK